MIIRVCANPEALGAAAACQTAQLLRDAIAECGAARIVLSTGASQFATIDHLSREDVDWSRVEMFHLDEYIGLPENHRASFQKYLKERFVDKVRGIKPHYVTGDPVHAAKVGALLQSGQYDRTAVYVTTDAGVWESWRQIFAGDDSLGYYVADSCYFMVPLVQ